ncbi:MAG: hypothetical protein LC720_04280 [Actinobacteria bacterium]|nr:hypothetical protein [Actinomycetota bacterium]
MADESDLPIKDYSDLTSAEINERLTSLSQIDLAKVDAYERKHQNRTTVLSKVATLRGNEPWPGYDEQTVDEIQKALGGIDDESELKAVRDYEKSRKGRATVIRATERELAQAGA